MSNGYDIQRYNRAVEIAECNNLIIKISGDHFAVEDTQGKLLGMLSHVNELFTFITGYDQGFEYGRYIGRTEK